jgi:hypothetical protein
MCVDGDGVYLYVAVSFTGGGNRSTQRKPPTYPQVTVLTAPLYQGRNYVRLRFELVNNIYVKMNGKYSFDRISACGNAFYFQPFFSSNFLIFGW